MRYGPFEFRSACACDAVLGPPSDSLSWPTDSAGLAVFKTQRDSSTVEKLLLTPSALLADAVLSPFELLLITTWW